MAIEARATAASPSSGRKPAPPSLAAAALRRSFGGIEVLHGVDLELHPGEVHALLGENGAGKSTIINMLSGRLRPDSGEILLNGVPVSFRNPLAARRAGVSVIAQELELVPTMSVVENVFLGVEPTAYGLIRWGDAGRKVRAVLRELGLAIDPDRIVSTIGVADQQLVEIAKAIIGDFRVLIMDEPTSALNLSDTERLFKIVRRLKSAGVAILYVSHRLWEVFDIADRVTVVRDGNRIFTEEIGNTDVRAVIRGMLGPKSSLLEGAERDRAPRVSHAASAPAIELRGISSGGLLKGIDLTVAAGEVVGLAGVIGSGRAELCEAIYGLRSIDAGEIRLRGVPAVLAEPRHSLSRGTFLLPEDRKLDGVFADLDVRENVILNFIAEPAKGRASGLNVIRGGIERSAFSAMRERLGIRCPGATAPITALSGGNQQKALFARAALSKPSVLILSEPTRGVDVGAKEEIYAAIDAFAAQGIAVIVSSSEIGELIRLSDRIQVLRGGRIVGQLPAAQAAEQTILEMMAG